KAVGFERLIDFTFEATNEMGDRVTRKIFAELIGNAANIVLVDEKNKIIDALKRSDISSGKRLIQPGALYNYPEPQIKLDIRTADICDIILKIKEQNEKLLSTAILETIGGISPLIAREILYKAKINDVPICEISDFSPLKNELQSFAEFSKSEVCPLLILKNGAPFDFSYCPINQYGEACETKRFESLSELLDAFYSIRERDFVKRRITGEVTKLVSNLIVRANKRMSARKNELISCENREELRIKGELIKANIGVIKAGQPVVKVQNFYDENLSEITIKLDPALSPQNNAARYFKEYKKKSVAANTLNDFILEDEKEIEYLNSVLDFLSRCETTAELNEIKAELKLSGYIKPNPKDRSKKTANSSFKEYKSVEGYRIIVGKNNIQNDLITTKMAAKNDMWFHTKNIHGSHVVVFCEGKDLSDETVIFAATLAAKNSKAAASSKVPVDYTMVKNVKKPAGAKPGMVIYKANKTVFVTP
ncbi:MAG: NFACT family protein, partial [Clostridia bacterium]|nr:NFACT family protein [Clostridia bacterium]